MFEHVKFCHKSKLMAISNFAPIKRKQVTQVTAAAVAFMDENIFSGMRFEPTTFPTSGLCYAAASCFCFYYGAAKTFCLLT